MIIMKIIRFIIIFQGLLSYNDNHDVDDTEFDMMIIMTMLRSTITTNLQKYADFDMTIIQMIIQMYFQSYADDDDKHNYSL